MRAAVLRSLCSVADAGGEPSSYHFAHGEPLLRPFARGAAKRALAKAAGATKVEDPEHVARLALLMALGAAAPVDPNDPQAVAFAYETAAGPIREAGGGFWGLSSALLVVGLGALAVFLYLRLRPTPEEAFMRSPLGRALGEPLGEYVIALDKGPHEREEKREEVLSSGVRKQLGGELADGFEKVLLEAERTKKGQDDGGGLRAAIEALDDGFAKAHVPAFLDAYHREEGTRRALWLMSFYAEDRARVTIRGQSLSVAHVRRLDSLNLETSFVAWRREGSDWLAVSIDLLEVDFAKEYLNALDGARELQLSEQASGKAIGELSTELTTAVRGSFPGSASVDPAELHEIRELADRRQASVVRLLEKKQVLMGEGALLLTPPRYEFLAKYRAKEHDVDDFLETHDRMKLHAAAIGRLTAVLGAIMEEEVAAQALLQRAKYLVYYDWNEKSC
jgi:hypothetical protein